MPTKFSLRKFFKSPGSKRAGNPEVQNDRHPPDGPTTPPVALETPKFEAETSMAPELSRPQNPSVTASVDEDNTKVASSSVTKPQVRVIFEAEFYEFHEQIGPRIRRILGFRIRDP
jgi:hypothetical protein